MNPVRKLSVSCQTVHFGLNGLAVLMESYIGNKYKSSLKNVWIKANSSKCLMTSYTSFILCHLITCFTNFLAANRFFGRRHGYTTSTRAPMITAESAVFVVIFSLLAIRTTHLLLALSLKASNSAGVINSLNLYGSTEFAIAEPHPWTDLWQQ